MAYLKHIVAGARRMWLKTGAIVPPNLSSVKPGHQMLGAEEEKGSNIT